MKMRLLHRIRRLWHDAGRRMTRELYSHLPRFCEICPLLLVFAIRQRRADCPEKDTLLDRVEDTVDSLGVFCSIVFASGQSVLEGIETLQPIIAHGEVRIWVDGKRTWGR